MRRWQCLRSDAASARNVWFMHDWWGETNMMQNTSSVPEVNVSKERRVQTSSSSSTEISWSPSDSFSWHQLRLFCFSVKECFDERGKSSVAHCLHAVVSCCFVMSCYVSVFDPRISILQHSLKKLCVMLTPLTRAARLFQTQNLLGNKNRPCGSNPSK